MKILIQDIFFEVDIPYQKRFLETHNDLLFLLEKNLKNLYVA